MFNKVTTKKLSQRLFRTIMVSMLAFVLAFLEPTLLFASAAETTNETDPVKTTQSTMEYYQSIEKANAERQINAFTDAYGAYMDAFKSTSKGIGSQSIFKVIFEPEIAALLGVEDLKSVEADIITMQNNKKTNSIISLSANEKKFTTLNVLTDIKKDLVYLLVPELNKAYLKFSNNNLYSQSVTGSTPMMSSSKIMELLNNNPLTEDVLNKLLKKYSTILFAEINDITICGKDQVNANGVAADYTKVVAKLDTKTVLSITEKVLKAAKEDKDLLNLCVAFNLCSKEEYNLSIQQTLDAISIQKEAVEKDNTLNRNVADMTMYVDGNGIITGREFTFDAASKIPSFGYKTAKNNNNIGLEVWYKATDKEEIKIAGKVTTENNAKSGNVAISYTDSEGKKTQPINVSLENVKYTYEGTSGYIDGKITVNGDLMSGISIVANCSGNSTQQVMDMDVLQADKRIVGVSMKTLLLDYQDFKLPSKSDVIYDLETDMDKYLSTSDVKEFLQGINKNIDIKAINLYLDQIISLY